MTSYKLVYLSTIMIVIYNNNEIVILSCIVFFYHSPEKNVCCHFDLENQQGQPETSWAVHMAWLWRNNFLWARERPEVTFCLIMRVKRSEVKPGVCVCVCAPRCPPGQRNPCLSGVTCRLQARPLLVVKWHIYPQAGELHQTAAALTKKVDFLQISSWLNIKPHHHKYSQCHLPPVGSLRQFGKVISLILAMQPAASLLQNSSSF